MASFKQSNQSKEKVKNLFNKERPVDNPYEVWKTPDGSWEWRVLKKYQIDDYKPYARWFCAVKSPYTYGKFDMGDTYVADIKAQAVKQKVMEQEFARDEAGKISDTVLSDYGKQELDTLDGIRIHFTDIGFATIKGDKLIADRDGTVVMDINSDRKVNKLIYRIL